MGTGALAGRAGRRRCLMTVTEAMIWFIVTTVAIVVVIGGGMVMATRSYDRHGERD
jgi:hypothetical protein